MKENKGPFDWRQLCRELYKGYPRPRARNIGAPHTEGFIQDSRATPPYRRERGKLVVVVVVDLDSGGWNYLLPFIIWPNDV